jgi:hypothetical protein
VNRHKCLSLEPPPDRVQWNRRVMTRVAQVFLNGVEVGTLPVGQYAAIRREVWRDWRPYLRLLSDLVAGFARPLGVMVALIPLAMLAFVLFLAYQYPADLGHAVTLLASGNADGLLALFRLSTMVAAAGVIVWLGFLCLVQRLPFSHSPFERAIGARALIVLGEPATGRVEVWLRNVNT